MKLQKYLLLLFFYIYSFSVSSEVLLDQLVKDLDNWMKADEKIRIDFSESKYSRNATNFSKT